MRIRKISQKYLLTVIHYKIVCKIKKPETLEFRGFLDKKLLPFTSIKINLWEI